MSENEKLKNEVRELLAGEKSPSLYMKKAFVDSATGQISLKLPRDFVLEAGIGEQTEFKLVFNPSTKEIEEADRSIFIIYGKEKEQPTK
jgi:hypothetical protein